MPKSIEFWITALVLLLAAAVFAIWRGHEVIVKVGCLLLQTKNTPAKREPSDKVRVAEGLEVGRKGRIDKVVGDAASTERRQVADIQVAKDMKVEGIVGEITGRK